ncbi:hypothetical protein [Acuticoccus sp.]|uniref:hypothetical protein n=1 Tax=Acuticoccus sp. TaxID=1904378 RepID=UPI003B519A03
MGEASEVSATLVYAAYLASPALPIVAIVGMLVATRTLRRRPPVWLASHGVYQVRTFWGALAGYLLTLALGVAGIDVLVYPLVALWLVARSVHGIVRAARSQGIEDPYAFFV